MKRNKKLGLALGSFALLGALVAALAVGLRQPGDAGASDFQQLREAIARAEARSGEAAANVNGVEIPVSKLEAFAIARYTQGIGTEGRVSSMTVQDFLEELIDTELLYQEATRRGLVPSDDEVLASARQTKAALQEALRTSDDSASSALRAMFAELEGTPYHLDVYDSSPVILESMRRSIAVSHLRVQIGGAAQGEEREVLVAAFVDSLREMADIEVLVDF
ncbi:MAG TPA: SurA N-terminal domain-containing protein [Tepidiformaceae bacterium]|nr:SurA N-terminal domain-containing protein [Tepidiformaceae bacterium]